MKELNCSKCGGFMGKSSRVINEKYKDEKMNKVMEIKLLCTVCCKQQVVELLSKSEENEEK